MMQEARTPAKESLVVDGYALPGDWYTDPAIFALEKNLIFLRSWQYAGLTQQIPNPGDYFRCRAGHVPLVIVRDDARVIHAHVNVCRHRGHEVVTQSKGNRKTLQCQYHGWTYGLDGALRAAPRYNDHLSAKESDLCLSSIRVSTLGPFIFVNPDLRAAPLDDKFGNWLKLVEDTGIDLEAMLKPSERREYELDSNWKVAVDNFLECYHCALNHPGLREILDLTEDYWFEEYEYFSMQGPKTTKASSLESAPSGRRPAVKGRGLVSGDGLNGHFSFLWPNLIFSILPDGVTINVILPLGLERSLHVRHYCFPDWVSDQDRKDFMAFMDNIVAEDQPLCASVQRGLESGFYRSGPLSSSCEPSLRHFQRLVYRSLTENTGTGSV
jgi:choline monooxygenase